MAGESPNIASHTRAGRIAYLDFLRALAIVLVVVLHVAAQNWGYFYPDTPKWQALNIYDSLCRSCVPLFVMISGSLMLDPARSVGLPKLLKKSLPRLAIAFLVWSAVYVAYDVWQGVLADPSKKDLLAAYLQGHFHLWYLQMLAFLYLCVPVLRKLCEDRRLTGYFLILWAVFCLVPNLLMMSETISPFIRPAFENMGPGMATGYVGYFVLGYYLATAEPGFNLRVGLYAAAIASVVWTALGSLWVSLECGYPCSDLYEYLLPTTALVAAALFVGAKSFFSRKGCNLPVPVAVIADASFGIYLVHILFVDIFDRIGFSTASMNAVVAVPAISVVVLACSLLVVVLLKKIPLLNKCV